MTCNPENNKKTEEKPNTQMPSIDNVSSALPISSPNTQAAAVSQQNVELKTQTKFVKPQEQVINQQSVNAFKTQEKTQTKIPSVRNNEETFSRMIFQSTRVV